MSSSQPQTQIISEGEMVGGNLVGVASKLKDKSLKVFMGGKTYRDWEFLWNPLQGQQTNVVAPGATPANGQQPGAASPGGFSLGGQPSPGSPQSPNPLPPPNPQNPNPQS
jgi:hypothetical protein